MPGTPRGIHAIPVLSLLLLVLGLATATSSLAATGDLTYTPAKPTVGEKMTFTEAFVTECDGTKSWTFTVDGVERAPQSTGTLEVTFTTVGSHVVSAKTAIDPPNCGGSPADTVTFDVSRAFTGTIDLTPDPPIRNQAVTIDATPDGGTPGYTYAWDSDDDGAFDDETTFEIQKTYTTLGQRRVRVRISDNAPNQHTAVVAKTFTVQDPPPPPPPAADGTPAAPPAPPPCRKQVAFQLSEFTTTGCFTPVGGAAAERWTTRAPVKLNGIQFPAFGQVFTITADSPADPGGHFTAPNATIQLDGFNAYSGDVDWSLPAGIEGQEKVVKTIPVALGAKIAGLNVRGTIALELGWIKGGRHNATFPLNIELPAGLETTPNKGLSRATGSAAIKVDETGVAFDGLQLKAENVWLGKLKVVQVCFSFAPANAKSVVPCATPTLGSDEYLTCKDDTSVDRWAGNAVFELPGKGSGVAGAPKPQLAAFGGLAGGNVSKLGGYVDSLGTTFPIAPNVFLNRVGFGLCISPLTIRGDLGVGIVNTGNGPLATVDGTILYEDNPDGFGGWKLTAGGSVRVRDQLIGEGNATLRSWGGVDFGVKAGLNLYDIVSLDGQISGWVDPPKNLFSVTGSVKACVGGSICAEGSGAVSSVGAAGCVTIYSTAPSPDLLITFDPLRVRFAETQFRLTAGFGYRWGASSPDLFGNSCDFAPYSLQKSFARAAQAGGGIPLRIARDTQAISLRVKGSNGPPKLVLRGPGGRTIASPAVGTGAQVKGRYLLAENKPQGTTNVVLIKPAAGTWTVSAKPGTTSRPTRVDTAKSELPASIDGAVRRKGAGRSIELAYALPRGTSLRLVERATGVTRTVASSVKGRRCPNAPRLRPGSDQLLLCASIPFTPAAGPGGTRRIQALVTRDGLTVKQEDVGSFVAPKLRLPARVGVLRARRSNGFLVVALPRSRGASRLAVSATLTDGRVLGYDLATTCRQLLIPAAPLGIGARVVVTGVRQDLETGPGRSITIAPDAASAGPKGMLPRRLWKPVETCR